MKFPAQDAIGITAIVFLLWWIWSHKSGDTIINQAAPDFSLPPWPKGSIYNLPPAPDLHITLNQLNPSGPTTTGPGTTSANPCACSCDEGANNQVTQTLNDFTKSLTDAMGKTFDTYLGNIVSAFPVPIKQFLDNPAAVAAAGITTKQLGAMANATQTTLRVQNVAYNPITELNDALYAGTPGAYGLPVAPLPRANNISLTQINQFVPGRSITFGAA